MSDDYMCPFCVNPSKCNGPHIEPEDLANFDDFVRQWSEDMRAACIAAVEAITRQHPRWKKPGTTHYQECWIHHPECALLAALVAVEEVQK